MCNDVDVKSAVLSLLSLPAESQSCRDRELEGRLLEEVAVENASCYDFSSGSQGAIFKPLFQALMKHRFLSEGWIWTAPADGRLRVVQSLRLLTRDASLRKGFVEMGGIKVLASLTEGIGQEHFQPFAQGLFHLETLTECASIAKKLAAEDRCAGELVDSGITATLVSLLHTTDPALLPLLLVALIGIASSADHVEAIFPPGGATDTFDLLLRMIDEYDILYKRLAADLLSLATRNKSALQELLAVSPSGKMLGQLHCGDQQLVQTLLRVFSHVAAHTEGIQEISQIGGIPVIVSILSPPTGTAVELLSASRMTEIQLVCLVLCRMAEDDESAYQIRQCNGVYLLGRLLLLQQMRSDPSCRDDAALFKAHLFMALRFLFSMERNRKVFKRLFPPGLFAAFIDTGHYQFSLPRYSEVVQRWDGLGDRARRAMATALEDINLFKGDAHRKVREYVILEKLGQGAFGSVYKARRSGSELFFALKELPLSESGIFGMSEAEKEAEIRKLTSEVKILSQLSHPNIVTYHESFLEDGCLWIVMELVEGLSLMDYTASLLEKGRRMPESDIWQVFVGLVMALHHIHIDKGIVHRDIAPGNIVLGHGRDGLRQVKIADFGLAKQKKETNAMMQSVVGTMPYSCPEIIQQEQYTDKADIWSLGCVLYHMCMLRGPFEGSNPLQVAALIVEGRYPPLDGAGSQGPYSDELKHTVAVLLSTDPSKRPSIREVAALCSGHLIQELTSLAVSDSRLRATLEYERNKRREDREVQSRKEEAFRRLVSFGQAPSQQAAPAPSAVAPLRTHSSKRLPPLQAHGGGALPDSPAVARLQPSGADSGIKQLPAFGRDVHDSGSLRRDTIKINQARLRPVRDPLAQILHQLHKICWVEQLPPGQARDHKRRLVVAFKRHLFGSRQNAGSIKSLLVKLQAGGPELVESFGTSGGTASFAGGAQFSYQDLQHIIEETARESGFYKALREES
uniref:non-specific serine/threonine protein kinase n=1 Tax=Tetraselmis sp. GSL018 TaxID=582737 RepID=A0A061SM17_9CHLO